MTDPVIKQEPTQPSQDPWHYQPLHQDEYWGEFHELRSDVGHELVALVPHTKNVRLLRAAPELLAFVEAVAGDPHEPDCRLQYGHAQCRCLCVRAAALVAKVRDCND